MFSETGLTVRYAETDRMGIVHHSVYAIWFEVGRSEFLQRLGSSYSEIEASGVNMPLTELTCRFCGSATYEDEIVVRTSITNLTCARMEFGYEVFKKGVASPITTGTTTLAFTDDSLKVINLKKKRPEMYDMMQKAFAGEEK